MNVQVGEIYGKQTAKSFVMYHVLKINKGLITLQNIDNSKSLFETTERKLTTLGYIRVSQTPYIDTKKNKSKAKKTEIKPTRCPYTLDFLASRADSERPAPIYSDLFSQD